MWSYKHRPSPEVVVEPFEPVPSVTIAGSLTQAGTAAPSAIIFVNSIGITPTFTRLGAGSYVFSLEATFTDASKIFLLSALGARLTFLFDNVNDLIVTTYAADGVTPSDDLLSATSFELRVYS